MCIRDRNKDGKISKGEATAKVRAYMNRQRGGIVDLKGKLGDTLSEFFTHSHTQMEREATADMEPQIINLGSMEGESGPGVAATSLDDNMPLGNLPARDSCPLSIYYRYHPSFNPQGFNP